MQQTILLVEDDAAFRKTLAGMLKMHGYRTLEAGTGKKGVEAARKSLPDLVILDLMLPGIHGLEVCQLLKQHASTAGIPILILTGEDKDGQDIACLDMGADDYLTKPAKAERLLAYCRALLRRHHSEETRKKPKDLSVGPLKLEYARKIASLGERSVPHLTPKEFDVLYELAEVTPDPMDRVELYKRIWGMDPPSDGSLKTVEVHVRRIRLKMKWRSDEWITSVSGRGYVLQAPG